MNFTKKGLNVMAKEWLDLDEEIEAIDMNKDYIYVDLGVNPIDPSKIVALSRELDQGRLEFLREKISQNGWQDIHPNGIDLILLSGERYAVGSGGNHRSVVSNEFGIKEIKAHVGTYIQKSALTESEISFCEERENKRSQLTRLLREETDEAKRENMSIEIDTITLAIDNTRVTAYNRMILEMENE